MTRVYNTTLSCVGPHTSLAVPGSPTEQGLPCSSSSCLLALCMHPDSANFELIEVEPLKDIIYYHSIQELSFVGNHFALHSKKSFKVTPTVPSTATAPPAALGRPCSLKCDPFLEGERDDGKILPEGLWE